MKEENESVETVIKRKKIKVGDGLAAEKKVEDSQPKL